MSIFGDDDDRYSDAALIKAARKRLLRELSMHGAASSSNTINNNIGSGGSDVGGLMGLLGRGGGQEPGAGESDPFDYLVDIERKNTPEGWTKTVRRHRTPKDHEKKK